MNMSWLGDMNWFAVHTKRFREALAVSSLTALGVEAFLPQVKVDSPSLAVIKRLSQPLFPAYCFARFIPETSLGTVEGARGVLHVIKAGLSPVPVEAVVIQEIKERVDSDGLIHLQPRTFRAGDRVLVQEGPFAGMLGQVETELDDRKRVAVLLKALWNARVLIEKQCLEAI
jgi:transcriptional antiterminator RfaH